MYKRLKTGNSKWARVDELIKDEQNQFVLFELPKGVNFNFIYYIV